MGEKIVEQRGNKVVFQESKTQASPACDWSLAVPSHLPKSVLYLTVLSNPSTPARDRITAREVGARW